MVLTTLVKPRLLLFHNKRLYLCCALQHDSGVECTPFSRNPPDQDGNYIMFASATSGDRPNNREFSECSIRNMTQVIVAVLDEKFGKTNCFTDSEEGFCGNKIVEDDEKCDCGYEDDCENTECCYPKGHPQECQLKGEVECRWWGYLVLMNHFQILLERKWQGSLMYIWKKKTIYELHLCACSPSQGPCCTQDCELIALDANHTCAVETECQHRASCKYPLPISPLHFWTVNPVMTFTPET